jgi:hypothetical protein
LGARQQKFFPEIRSAGLLFRLNKDLGKSFTNTVDFRRAGLTIPPHGKMCNIRKD